MRQLTLLTAAVLCLAATPTLAQSDLKLGGGSKGTGKVMSFNELEACIKQQDSLQARRPQLEARVKTMEAERAEIEKENAALEAEKANLSGNERVAAFRAKMDEFNARVNSYTERLDAYNKSDNKSSLAMVRESKALEKEAKELKALEAANKAEADAVNANSEKGVAEFNARAKVNAERAAAWNAKHNKLADDQVAYEDDREEWSINCANRRYREDDEKAIRAEMANAKP